MKRTIERKHIAGEHAEGERFRDVTRALGGQALRGLKRVFDMLPSKPPLKTRTDTIEWAMSLAGALKDMAPQLAEKAFKLPSSQKDKKTLLDALTQPTLASALFLGVVTAAQGAGAETMKKQLHQKTEKQHELVVDMKKDSGIGQFIPERKPYEAILYDAAELYPQLREWKAKHPNVKRVEVSEFRAAVKHTHDDVKRIHKTESEVVIIGRVYLKDGSKRSLTVKGTGQGLPESLNYYAWELGQNIADTIGAKTVPDSHKNKSPFYEDISREMSPGFSIAVRNARGDAIRKLFHELDSAVTSDKRVE